MSIGMQEQICHYSSKRGETKTSRSKTRGWVKRLRNHRLRQLLRTLGPEEAPTRLGYRGWDD